ncbi:MAG: D-glycero-alpha-D-manno-heptose-1,7-bisphosphate 7-phosphatase [Hyphomicrobiaceae bacterium]
MIVIEGNVRGSLSAPRPALFLDRDGVINVDHGYVHKAADFDWCPGIFELCEEACAEGHIIVVVTNQGGIARGLYTERDFRSLTLWMLQVFAQRGIAIAQVIGCPHHPEGLSGPLRLDCACRKPNPGMLLHAAHGLSLDLKRSALIGDRSSDMLAAARAGVERRILLGQPTNNDSAGDGADVIQVTSLGAAQRTLFGTPDVMPTQR